MIQKLSATVLCAGFALALTACSSSSGTSSSSSSSAPGSGSSITAAGSTALLPLVKQAAADYQTKHPGAKISVSGGGSRVGITQAAQKGVDIGDSDILAPEQPSLVDHPVAVVQFDVVVNPASGLKNLTTAQVQAIFSGKVTNFKQVGGKDQPLTVINRPRSSGTRAVFVKVLMNGAQPIEGGATQDSSGTVASIVSQTPGAISYVGSSYVKGANIVGVALNGVAPIEDNTKSGKYPFWSYEHMFTNGTPSAAAAAFIDFVKTDSTALRSIGFIALSDMKAPKK
jgi:phosphate transport system substrate-binding protein